MRPPSEAPPTAPSAGGVRTAVVGAGLAGSLMATYLARRGHSVDVYERRPDLRAHPELGGGRSINLALSTRGIRALQAVGLADRVLETAIPMKGRMMHAVDGTQTFQPYGRADQAIQSVSRRGLNELLMDAAERAGARIHFGHSCAAYDPETGGLRFKAAAGPGDAKVSGVDVQPELVVAADGVYSAVRARLQRQSRFDFEQLYLGHGYTELEIPPGPDGGFQLEPNYLHIWPRGDFMLIALPNADRSFTCTLFLAFEAEDGVSDPARDVVRAMRGEDPEDVTERPRRDPRDCYAALTDEASVRAFFERHFPDAVPLMPRYVQDMLERGGAPLCTIRCFPYHQGDHTVLVGDAAHAVVPFYGQGMNAAFEDCFFLDALLAEHGDATRQARGATLRAFTATRKANGDAIRELALYNFVVMRDSVASTGFLLRKKLEAWLHRLAPDAWVPLYTMVTFSHTPYAEAQARARRQERLLDRVLVGAAALGLAGLAAGGVWWLGG